ncbi:hypothetical protein ADK38_30260 [Streptomyces varsoviensis]|uniref:Secreted protein n=1 Tax=Streptomyces varsoviensis TaxID=67373 RepID=A0ABR5IZI5_9ACTN|nr:hypothetical protein ADK38_30260 [Streptomyces varsoviensis]
MSRAASACSWSRCAWAFSASCFVGGLSSTRLSGLVAGVGARNSSGPRLPPDFLKESRRALASEGYAGIAFFTSPSVVAASISHLPATPLNSDSSRVALTILPPQVRKALPPSPSQGRRSSSMYVFRSSATFWILSAASWSLLPTSDALWGSTPLISSRSFSCGIDSKSRGAMKNSGAFWGARIGTWAGIGTVEGGMM